MTIFLVQKLARQYLNKFTWQGKTWQFFSYTRTTKNFHVKTFEEKFLVCNQPNGLGQGQLQENGVFLKSHNIFENLTNFLLALTFLTFGDRQVCNGSSFPRKVSSTVDKKNPDFVVCTLFILKSFSHMYCVSSLIGILWIRSEQTRFWER